MSATRPNLLATIDIGTNSVLLQIARAGERGEVEVLSDQATITRLGRGVDQSGRLDEAAIARTLEVLQQYAEKARSAGARIVAVGTSALRDAQNADAFLVPARELLGTRVEVISGAREAALTFIGATRGLALDAAERCVVDIGGGSTEIVLGRGEEVVAATSLDIGSVRLTERHALDAPASAATLRAIDADVERALDASPVTPCAPLVAIAGTATTLAAIELQMRDYDPARIHGAKLTRVAIESLCARLAAMTLDERAALPGLDRRRADVIVTGARILLALASRAQAAEIIVSNGGVRVGLAVTELSQKLIDQPRSSE